MKMIPAALMPLTNYAQFVVYSLMPSATRPGKTDKLPINPKTGKNINAHDKKTWMSGTDAIISRQKLDGAYGIGFVLTENDPFFCIDLDNCVSEDGKSWSPVALSLLQAFNGAAVEVSSSGKGLHIIGSGKVPPHGCKNSAFNIELYTEKRFIALTGIQARGSAGVDCNAVLPWLVENYFTSRTLDTKKIEWTIGPCEGWLGPTDDQTLINRALRSQSARAVFGSAASFRDLWEANIEVLSRVYPDATRAYDASSADAALAQHLAFWTGKDCERIQKLMFESGLRRDKWQREDYLRLTIIKAYAQQKEFLTDKTPQEREEVTPVTEDVPKPSLVSGATFLSVDQMIELFKGCTYVTDSHSILVPGGILLKPEQFKVRYGGYSFPVDSTNTKVTKDAWEAFTNSQAIRAPVADTYCFRPDRGPGIIIQDGPYRLVNTYWPVASQRGPGDVTPFLRHLEKMLPNELDRLLFMSYLAAIVQYRGYKFNWAALLQGVEGNGKSIIAQCVAYAVGARYSYFPNATTLASNFNSWMYGVIFVGVEDIYRPEAQQEFLDALKPMITSRVIEIENKGRDKINREVCCNFLLNTNHKNGLRKTRNDRRLAMFFCAQQDVGDLDTFGMGGRYFPEYDAWLRGTGEYAGDIPGYAIVSELLHTFPIPPEYNPATLCHRAPLTSTTELAITAGLGRVEQEILEAVDQGIPGFCGGWISSIALDRLLERIRAANIIPPNRRRDMLQTLGYAWHPGLKDGRVNNTIPAPDAGKPKLYIKAGHKYAGLTSSSDITRAYVAAQNVGAMLSTD